MSFVLAFAVVLASLGTSIANVALPTIATAFSAPVSSVQWLVTAYLIAVTISVVAIGRLGDRVGLKRALAWGLVLFSIASLLCALSPSLWVLVAMRAVQGFAAAFLMTLTVALVREVSGPGGTGKTMGVLATMSAFGTALGPR